MNTLRILVFAVVLGCMACACSDFFEEESQNKAYVASLADLDELLKGETYINEEGFSTSSYYQGSNNRVMYQTNRYFPWIHVLDDDVTEFAEGYYSSRDNWIRPNAASAYTWSANPFTNKDGVEYAADDWNKAYKRIAVLNSVLYSVNDFREGESDTLANRVEGEAAFLRAYYYYWLVNIYAQPYSVETCGKDLGVPLKISEVVEDKYFSRNSVKEVYDQIRTDLRRSVVAFKNAEDPARPNRANYTAACILMSRVSLYMEVYEDAIAYADSAIARGRHSILDINGLKPGDSFTYERSPETAFTMGGYIMNQIHQPDSLGSYSFYPKYSAVSAYKSSDELLRSYSTNDLRRSIFLASAHWMKSAYHCWKSRETTGRIGDYMLFRIPEAYLIKAECQAILGDESGAKQTLNVLREKRFLAGHMPSIESEMVASGEDLVNFVRSERRRELCYEGHRWFDLRRYAVNSKFPFTKKIRHEVREWQGAASADGYYTTAGYYEIDTQNDREVFAFPLPQDEIIFNKGALVQNADRPKREMVRY